jgi:predicted phosphoribosyltransferase
MAFKRYESRFEAGEILADIIQKENNLLFNTIQKEANQIFCYAIPNGGIPVAEGLCSRLNIGYDMLIVRKIKIPYNTEAGFGAVTTDGTILINEPLLRQLNLSENEVKASIDSAKREISERLKYYNKNSKSDDLYKERIQNKYIFMVDDGLASGFTMMAAIKMVRKYNPQKIYVAVPTSPLSSVKRIKNLIDGIFCPNIRNVWQFAVADAYKNWYDLSESEVLEIINKSEFYLKY